MTKITDLSLRPGEDEARLYGLAAQRLGRPESDIAGLTILRKGLDARRRGAVRWVYSVSVRLRGEPEEAPEGYNIPRLARPERPPVVAGFGPAGIFAALVLSRAGPVSYTHLTLPTIA